jgi:uroporphyrinogen-III decarboxylase
MDKNWSKLSPDEKFEARFAGWISPEGMQFASTESEQAYKERTQMIKDVVELKKPVRIPVCPNIGFYPFSYAGVSGEEAMYDTGKLGMALNKYHADFLPDSLASAPIYGSGQIFDILDYKLYRWPGRGVPANTPYQCVEAEYMLGDEYDQFINDPSGYFARFYLPRVFGALAPWQMTAPLTDILELPFFGPYIVPIGIPPVQEAYLKLLEAGRAAMEWIQACGAIDAATVSTLGIPSVIGGFTKAPFDTLGDTLRGTRAIMLDMYRQPKKLLAAMDRLVPLAIDMGVRTATLGKNPMVFIPLHKGADGFMSDKDFKTFYWPTLKAVILGLIQEGLVPYIFVEGGYNQRLDVITDQDIPPGKTAWIFDQSNLKEVKQRFSGWACFGGNVPVSLLKAATPEAVADCVKDLIDTVGQDGGYILSTGAVVDDAVAENMHALIDTGKEYGKY